MTPILRKLVRSVGNFVTLFSVVTGGILIFATVRNGLNGQGWDVSISGITLFVFFFGIIALAGYGIKALAREPHGGGSTAPFQPPRQNTNPDLDRWTRRS